MRSFASQMTGIRNQSGQAPKRIPQANPQRAGRADQGAVAVDGARAADDLFERHVDHLAVPPRHHAVGLAIGQEVDGAHAQRRGEQAVLGRRHGAALDMAQHRGARLRARLLAEPMRQPVADAVLRRIERIVGMPGRLGHHDQRRAAAGRAQARDMLDHTLETPRHFGDQHDIGAAGDAGGDGDVAGVTAHHLQHHDPLVAGAGRLQAVERLGGDGDGRRIADGALGIGDVVVDGLGNADEGEPWTRQQAAQDVEAAVATDADQPVEASSRRPSTISPERSFRLPIRHREGEGIAAVGAAEEGAALARQRRIEPVGIERSPPRPAARAGRACRSGCRSWSSRSRDGRAAPRRGSWRSARRSRRRWSGFRFAWS